MTEHTALVTGGAGYIGSHVAWALMESGWRVVVLDDLSTGRRALVPPSAGFVQGSSGDGALLRQLLREQRIDSVLHFAGSIVVPESVADPITYYRNNLSGSIELIPSVGEADRVRGAVDAPVTLVGFGDYDCSYIVWAHSVRAGSLCRQGLRWRLGD